MAIIFENTHKVLSEQILYTMNTSGYWWIQLYSGTQPTIANFEANWNTNYYYNYATKDVGSDVLGLYGDVNSAGGSNVLIINATGSPRSWNLTDVTYNKVWSSNGTATWAAIFDSSSTSYVQNQTTSSFATRYFLAPVSDASGSGIVKLASTTVTGTLPDLADVSIAFST